MDFFDGALLISLSATAILTYLIFFKKYSTPTLRGNYREPEWNYPFRYLAAKFSLKRWKRSLPKTECLETPITSQKEGWDAVNIKTFGTDGTTVLLRVRKIYGEKTLSELTIHIKLADGTTYKLPNQPEIGVWQNYEQGWKANGLKIQVLEPQSKLRVMYNGLLTSEGVNYHVRFNFIWGSVSRVVRFPEDWSEALAAKALALEPRVDDQWHLKLSKHGISSWLQYGSIQGRFESSIDGVTHSSEYLRTRGIRERQWSPKGYEDLRRSVDIIAVAKDGTLVQLNAFSWKDVLTIGFSGSVRFPDYTVASIDDADLVLSDFAETFDAEIKNYTFNVTAKNRTLKLVFHFNTDTSEVRLGSGLRHQQHVVYRTFAVGIDGYSGTGVLELGYQMSDQSEKSSLSIPLTPPPSLVWLSETEVGAVTYCAPFESRVAMCPNYVGGKGASLALLSSVQDQQGYRVPAGYCLTTKALEKHLDENPQLKAAIREIEAANENYDENIFKEKCTKASQLFSATMIIGGVKEEIISNLIELRRKAAGQNLGPDLRFAVRSSAVGEDSEVLSAAGQNETILGCVSDEDVLAGVLRCWGSMFAFTSAHYRRLNGQPCLCGGGVVIQALVSARTAGVMFTRHPAQGDPSRLLITANYGLGESVVSGAVEPDTFILSRHKQLSISKMELGSKNHRITTTATGVTTVEVPKSEREIACLTEDEVLKLARIGVTQEELWGDGRDIEWAIVKDEIYLLQARPITSLERWTEEELLHELDYPIMADDELTTFANTGEVLPKPLTALSYDLVLEPINKGIVLITPLSNGDFYDKCTIATHNRAALLSYNCMYKNPPKTIDLALRMLEMSIHGHKVSDDAILATSHHRRSPSAVNALRGIAFTLKCLWKSKGNMEDTIKTVKEMTTELPSPNLLEQYKVLSNLHATMVRCAANHAYTSSASTVSQFLAMIVLVEGQSNFEPEQCNEINTLLSSGGVLSAEVPQALAKLTQLVHDSGKAEDFRNQDPKSALDWLKRNIPEVYNEVCLFLDEHGHRAIMEFDLATKPWVMMPEALMEVLQSMRPSPSAAPTKTNDDIINALKTPKKSTTRKILRWLLPLCQRTIRHRESTKAHVILAVHKLRIIALKLARQMVRQWYLPDEDLVFHFRLHELEEYIATRDPALLKKASLRRQYHPSWCKLKFAELNTGWVEPLKSVGPIVTADDVRLEATTVCGGEIIARACVVKDLSEIGQLRRGDILITHSTDIGWSPYFPLITGIVTELGGLISHGAVIAREYGLPCLVGAGNATDIFKTGDMVRLSATNGLIERVKMDDSELPERS